MQIATPRRCNDRRMILGCKNQMVMQAEMGRWHGWDFPPPLPGRTTDRIEFRWFAPPANFLMTLRVLPEHAHPPKTAKNYSEGKLGSTPLSARCNPGEPLRSEAAFDEAQQVVLEETFIGVVSFLINFGLRVAKVAGLQINGVISGPA